VYLQQKQYAEAQKDADASIKIFPEYSYAYFVRGEARRMRKETDFCSDYVTAQELGSEEADLIKLLKEHCNR
jgi:hypothetical protein